MLPVDLGKGFPFDGNTPLSWAAANGHDRVVWSLLERYDVQVNTTNRWGQTPLCLVAANGHKAIVGLLSTWEDVL